jgi:hypothetical protein
MVVLRWAGALVAVIVLAFALSGTLAGAKMKHKRKGGQTLPLSVQRTDGSGRYQVTLTKDAFPGTYRVVVALRKIRARKAPQRCLDTQSSTIAV